MFTEKRAKANEKRACSILNALGLGEFQLATGKYSSFDIFGRTSDNIPALVECKERNNWFAEMILEEQKFLDIFALGKKNKTITEYLLILNVGDEFLLYDMKDLWTMGRKGELLCNKRTAEGFSEQGEKVMKKMIYFPKTWFKLNLNTGAVGEKYEFTK